MGYEGGDLLLTGVARPVCAGCGGWPGWSSGSGQWRERIRGGWCHKKRYTNRRLTFFLSYLFVYGI